MCIFLRRRRCCCWWWWWENKEYLRKWNFPQHLLDIQKNRRNGIKPLKINFDMSENLFFFTNESINNMCQQSNKDTRIYKKKRKRKAHPSSDTHWDISDLIWSPSLCFIDTIKTSAVTVFSLSLSSFLFVHQGVSNWNSLLMMHVNTSKMIG